MNFAFAVETAVFERALHVCFRVLCHLTWNKCECARACMRACCVRACCVHACVRACGRASRRRQHGSGFHTQRRTHARTVYTVPSGKVYVPVPLTQSPSHPSTRSARTLHEAASTTARPCAMSVIQDGVACSMREPAEGACSGTALHAEKGPCGLASRG